MTWTSLMGHQNPPEFGDFSSLLTDIHSHILPGLDDGAQSLQDSLEMIRGMASLGFKKLILTPHVMSGFADNSSQTIISALFLLQETLKGENIEMELEAGAEYMVNDELEPKILSGDLLSFSNKHILLELSTYVPHARLKDMLFELNVAGFNVILAHPERYSYWYHDFAVFESLRAGGVLFQVNTLSFSGYYNPQYRKCAEALAEAGMIDFLGSDLHRTYTLPHYREALLKKTVQKLLGSGVLKNHLL
ncbi:MAG: tyrosine-protein phosphatase [Bacteroidales bacterium]